MFPITPVNKYKVPNHIYCGRGSALGNPFSHSKGTKALFIVKTRDEACDKYAEYFHNEVVIKKNPVMLKELREIYSLSLQMPVNLGCFCAPQRCHTETIRDFIQSFDNQDSRDIAYAQDIADTMEIVTL